MKLFQYERYANRVRFAVASGAAVGLLVAFPVSAHAAATPVPLGTAKSFVVLAGAGITNTGITTLHGDIGTFPTTSITPGSGSMTVTGTNHHGDSVTQAAKHDLVTAFNTAAGEGPTSPITANLDGRTLKRGVYNHGSGMLLDGTLTLDGEGDPDSVFVFQAGSTLTIASNSRVRLINRAQACNVFWQVGSSATLETGVRFVGTILALTKIEAHTGATVQGRLLARNAEVTLDTNTITRPAACTTGGTTGDQVGQTPSGGVGTGDGSTSGDGQSAQALLGGALVFAGIGGAAVVVARRRRLSA